MREDPLALTRLRKAVNDLRALGTNPTTISMSQGTHDDLVKHEKLSSLFGLVVKIDHNCPLGVMYVYNEEYAKSHNVE